HRQARRRRRRPGTPKVIMTGNTCMECGVRETEYYAMLGVASDASPAEIKSAYRALVRSMHPDAGGDARRFQQLRDAYETLYDPVKRAQYDRTRTRATPPQHASSPHTPVRRATGRGRRRDRFGDDPGFVASLPHISPASIPWWFEVDPAEPVKRGYHQPPGHAPLVVVFGGLLVLLVPAVLSVDLVAMLAGWMVTLLLVCGVSFWVARRLLQLVRAQRAFDVEFGDGVVHGAVGQEPEQWSERLTAELLDEYLSRLPGVRMFHG